MSKTSTATQVEYSFAFSSTTYQTGPHNQAAARSRFFRASLPLPSFTTVPQLPTIHCHTYRTTYHAHRITRAIYQLPAYATHHCSTSPFHLLPYRTFFYCSLSASVPLFFDVHPLPTDSVTIPRHRWPRDTAPDRLPHLSSTPPSYIRLHSIT